MSIAEKVFKKAFVGLDHTAAMLGILKEIDPTSLWPGYRNYGMFVLGYALPEIRVVIGTGAQSISYIPERLQEEDMFVNLLKGERSVGELGAYPAHGTSEEKKAWLHRFVDFAPVQLLIAGIKHALNKQMWKFFTVLAIAHDEWYPDETPTLTDQLNELPRINYAEQFNRVLSDLLRQ